MIAAIHALPHQLEKAAALSWPEFEGPEAATSRYILGRGSAYLKAVETAHELRETCAIHVGGNHARSH